MSPLWQWNTASRICLANVDLSDLLKARLGELFFLSGTPPYVAKAWLTLVRPFPRDLSFGDVPERFINQRLVQLADCKTKAKQGQSRPIQHALGAI